MHHFDNSPLPLTPHRHFERSRPADFFFRIRSCECVGLRRETSAPSLTFFASDEISLLFLESRERCE